VTIRGLRPLAAVLQTKGIAPAEVFAPAGLSEQELGDGDFRVAHDLCLTLWRGAESATNDGDIGLLCAAMMDEKMADLLARTSEYLSVRLALNSATVGDALRRIARYYAITDGGPVIQLDERGDELCVSWILPAECQPPRSYVEYTLAALIRGILCSAARPVAPLAVSFTHAAPASMALHARIFFLAPVSFGAPETGFVLAMRDLEVPLRTAQPESIAELERRGDDALASLSRERSWAQRLAIVLQHQLTTRELGADRAAHVLAISTRTLARRLADEGTSYQAEFDALRARLADRHIRGGRSVKQTADLLGYADTGAFLRAFRRWYQTTPAAVRPPGG
jgi:AraC-like DNA-binding protein